MEYKINQVPKEEEYKVGDYFVDNEGWLFRIVSIRIAGYTKYALLNVKTGRILTNSYLNFDNLAEGTALDGMTKVTQVSVAKFK